MSDTPRTLALQALYSLAQHAESLTPTRGYEDNADLSALSSYLAGPFRDRLDAAERAIADALPPIKVARDIDDPVLRGEVETWRARMGHDRCDVSELRGEVDDEEWRIVRGSSRFEVREVPRYEVRHDGGPGKVEGWHVHDNEQNTDADDHEAALTTDFADVDVLNEEQARTLAGILNERDEQVWIVWDTEEGADARDGTALHDIGRDDHDPADEDDARNAAEQANVEDYQQNAAGWPWAQNSGWTIDEHDADDFDAAGFVVAEHTPSGQWYAGIDGGGYDMLGAHWLPLYLRRAARNGWYVRTRDGLRRGGGVTERKPDRWQAVMLSSGAEPAVPIPDGYEAGNAPWEPIAAAGLPPLILWRRPLYRTRK